MALAVGTTVIISAGRRQYIWVTLIPMCFLATTTLSAGFLSVKNNFWPMAVGARPELQMQGYLNSIVTVIMMVSVIVILATAVQRWLRPDSASVAMAK